MVNILVRPKELRQISEQLLSSAKKIDVSLKAIDNDILSLKGDIFLGNRANVVQAHYSPKREILLRAKEIVTHFSQDLQSAAKRFEQADKGDSSQSPTMTVPSQPSVSEPNSNKMPKINEILLNQLDPQWANLKMNNLTGETLKNYGCLMTVISMIARANGVDATPAMVDKWIEAHGGYPSNGSYMTTDKQVGFLNDVLGKKGSMSTIYSDNATQNGLPNIAKNLNVGVPVILHIDSDINPKDGHFVLAIGMDSKGNYICADPNGGKQLVVSAGLIRDARVYK